MSLKDLIGKVASRIIKPKEDEFEALEKEFGEEAEPASPPGAGYEEDVEAPQPAPTTQPTTPEPEPTPAPQPQAAPEQADVRINLVQTALESIKGKLDMLETHLETIDSKASLQKAEEQRLMQYLTMINEKLDHLEQEHSELERMMKPQD